MQLLNSRCSMASCHSFHRSCVARLILVISHIGQERKKKIKAIEAHIIPRIRYFCQPISYDDLPEETDHQHGQTDLQIIDQEGLVSQAPKLKGNFVMVNDRPGYELREEKTAKSIAGHLRYCKSIEKAIGALACF